MKGPIKMNVVKLTIKKGRQKIEEDTFLRFGEGSLRLVSALVIGNSRWHYLNVCVCGIVCGLILQCAVHCKFMVNKAFD